MYFLVTLSFCFVFLNFRLVFIVFAPMCFTSSPFISSLTFFCFLFPHHICLHCYPSFPLPLISFLFLPRSLTARPHFTNPAAGVLLERGSSTLHLMTIINSPSPDLNEPNQSHVWERHRARKEMREWRNEDECLSSLMPVNAALTATSGSASVSHRLTCRWVWAMTLECIWFRNTFFLATVTSSTCTSSCPCAELSLCVFPSYLKPALQRLEPQTTLHSSFTLYSTFFWYLVTCSTLFFSGVLWK